MGIRSVCYQCPDRKVGCHAWCERYIAESKKRSEMREKMRQEKELQFADATRRYEAKKKMYRRGIKNISFGRSR